ncbi:MAG: hypothetical protein EOP20_00610 [Hyphomicrobiales bacterium]|nr:MAG: hypothetical protein EOP20_00610 [Hyphomicrobiales bacterium]
MLLSEHRLYPKLVVPPYKPPRTTGFIVIAGETFEDETDYSVPEHVQSADRSSMATQMYETPNPIEVLKLARKQGFHWACARWSMRSRAVITQWICAGRRAEGSLKTVGDDERDLIIATTAELCSVVRAARAMGISESRVYAAHMQAGIVPPTLTSQQKSEATKAGLEAAGKGKGHKRRRKPVQVEFFPGQDLGTAPACL